MSTQKEKFAQEIINVMQSLADSMDHAPAIDNEYFDNGYNSGGSDQIIDGDVSSLNITATEIGNCITLLQQLNNFFSNSAVTTADYAATINAVRRSGV